MQLNFGPVRTRGRAAKPLAVAVARELEEADLVLLGKERGSQAPALKRISDRHHSLARMLAGGMAEGEAAVYCGYSQSRISILKDDPAFQELLVFYRENVDREYMDLHQRLAGLAMDAAAELSTRLEERPEDISVGQLMELTKMGADRTGHGPQSSSTQLNVHIDMAGRLEQARKRAAQTRLIEPERMLENFRDADS